MRSLFRHSILSLLLAALLAGCSASTLQPTPTAGLPTLAAPASLTALKYQLLSVYPDLFFCDPDLWPVQVADEAGLALAAFPQLQADAEEFQAILQHNHLEGLPGFSADQKLLIYREHKKLSSFRFDLAGDSYQFQIQVKESAGQGSLISGLIDLHGVISVQSQEPSYPTCPICLAAQTLIDTPNGPAAVEDLRPGDMVWTQDRAGRRTAAPVVKTGQAAVYGRYQMVHLSLSDGRQIWASPAHPLPDGRLFAQLRLGDALDGAAIRGLERVEYTRSATYDILPGGETGYYWANGILVASTLR